MSKKTWTYAEITKATESAIRSYMEDTKGAEYDAIRTNFARGAYLLWSRLTMGWQDDGDDERLARLLNRDKEAQ